MKDISREGQDCGRRVRLTKQSSISNLQVGGSLVERALHGEVYIRETPNRRRRLNVGWMGGQEPHQELT